MPDLKAAPKAVPALTIATSALFAFGISIAAAASLRAQTVATPAVSASAATAPEPSKAPRLRISLVGRAARVRTARDGTVLPERDVFVRGVDVEYRLRAPLAVALRAHQSTLGGDDLTFGDIAALYSLGGLVERIGGSATRSAVGELDLEFALGFQSGYELATGFAHGENHGLTRLGVRAHTPLGDATSPLSFDVRLGRIMPPGLFGGERAPTGFDGETGLRWTFHAWPVDAALGYHFGRLDVSGAAQEVSALRFGISWRGVPGR